ncbi:MAG TPA: site-2 protease family protein [Syntrophomonadaceae bacterium]|nr:site-2 protease family protein [Syntrophomonadaceae bacterium]
MNQLLNDPGTWLENILIILPGILIALTFHEYAHGKVASWLGDPTPFEQGRLTLNPLPHIDWIGFIMLMFAGFGWAKPVQVDPRRFSGIGIKKGMMLVSLAGPGMNLLLALIGMIAFRIIIPYQGTEWGNMIKQLLEPLVTINLVLCAFNLIPVPPLDGSKILAGLLPDSGARLIYSLEPYGFAILLVLIITNVTGYILGPIVQFLASVLQALVF